MSVIFRVSNEMAAEAFALHSLLDVQVRLDIWKE